MNQKSDLPFGSEFSPTIIDLPDVLDLLHLHGGNKIKIEELFRQRFFETHSTGDNNKRKLAMNLRLGLQAYGLIDGETRLTVLGEKLFQVRHEPGVLYDMLARHILINRQGLTLVQCVRDMEMAGEIVTLITLRQRLAEMGIHFPRGGKHPSMMRLWLEKAGVFKSGWRLDEAKMKALTGLEINDLNVLVQMSSEQQAFLKALANVGGGGPYMSNEIEKLATATYGVSFNEKALPKTVLYPLEVAGLIALDRGTKEAGRGAKPFRVTTTDKFTAEILLPVISQLEQQTHADLRPFLRQPFAAVVAELHADTIHRRGLALEALALKLMRLIDLDYMGTRLRGSATGGAEVDVVFESSRLVYTRWQVQCKNTSNVSLDDVAKEVGLTHFLKSSAVVIVSTGRIGSAARQYANRLMTDTNLAIIMIDGGDITRIVDHPADIVEILTREAKHAMNLKQLEL